MKKTIVSVLSAAILLGGGSLASAEETATNNSLSPVVSPQKLIQPVAGKWVLDVFNGPVNKYMAGNSRDTAIPKFYLRSNQAISIKGWQDTNANNTTPNMKYYLVDTETNQIVATIPIKTQHKQNGEWYYKLFTADPGKSIVTPKYYRVDVENASSNGTNIGFDLYNNVYEQ